MSSQSNLTGLRKWSINRYVLAEKGNRVAVVGISEFTFGFAFLFEQTQRNWPDIKAAPILPNLQQEAGLGYDANLPINGIDYYYQFKLSDYLSRGNATYIKDNTYAGPYYRIALHRRENNLQHQRLRQHAQSHPHTYYVAPELNDLGAFNTSFLAREITENSRIIPISDCEDINDGDQHYITYEPGSLEWIQHSERKRHRSSYTSKNIEALYRDDQKTWQRIDRDFTNHLYRAVRNEVQAIRARERPLDQPVPQLLAFDAEGATQQVVLAHTADLLSVFFGLTLVLVGSR
jgi:hypothetical protein